MQVQVISFHPSSSSSCQGPACPCLRVCRRPAASASSCPLCPACPRWLATCGDPWPWPYSGKPEKIFFCDLTQVVLTENTFPILAGLRFLICFSSLKSSFTPPICLTTWLNFLYWSSRACTSISITPAPHATLVTLLGCLVNVLLASMSSSSLSFILKRILSEVSIKDCQRPTNLSMMVMSLLSLFMLSWSLI